MKRTEPLEDRRRHTLAAAILRLLPLDRSEETLARAAVRHAESAFLEPHFRDLRPLLERGLDELEATALEQHGRAFADCAEPEQQALLHNLAESRHWAHGLLLRALMSFAIEGVLGDPSTGANPKAAGWSIVGYSPEAMADRFCTCEESPN